MVQLKSFKTIEPTAAAAQADEQAELRAVESQVSGGGESASARQQQQQQQRQPTESADQKGWSFPSSTAQSGISSATAAAAASVPSSRSDSPATVLRRASGGGNLTSSETSSNRSSSSGGERKRRKRADKNQVQRQQSDEVITVGVSAVATSIGTSDSSSQLTTLSSNEEYQLARVEMGDDEDEPQQQQSGEPTKENVTRIDIGHQVRAASMNSEDTGAGGRSSPRQQPKHVLKLNLQQAHTQAEPVSQAHQQQQQQQPGTPQFASKNVERGKLTGPPPLSPPLSPALRSIAAAATARQQPDNMSQHSFAQAKYAGSKHFEIRWHNVRLFARPKSRLPSFISDNSLYKSLFGSDEHSTAPSGVVFEPSKPPYSPPLNHHKIPPTIDEHAEMKCPNSSGAGGVAETQVGVAAGISTTAPTTTTTTTSEGVRCILNSISGQVFSGQLTAVLGPSGVGKTSLLNSLTGRNTLDGTGRVSLIGAQESKRISVVTVPQNDVLPGKLTCLEDLQFTSRLKNPQARFDHKRNIDRLVKHLHMEKFLGTRIDKLSGGEARRLSIARELLSSPDIMILDEPTSGLDANTCKKIITALRDIVEHSENILDKPMSIIITIHQPQQEVYQLFHRVYVMAQGGRVVYEGSPQLLLPTLLEQSSLTRVCPLDQLNENPAIVAIEVASGEFGVNVIEELAMYHESKVYEEFSTFGVGPNALGNFESPMMTPRSLGGGRTPHKAFHRKRLNSFDSSLGRPTPQLGRRAGGGGGGQAMATADLPLGSPKMDRMSSMTSLSFASTYDDYLPEVTSRLKVDKRLRRSVVIKSHFVSHTLTLISRCWLLTRRDLFLMAIRILGFLMVAGGTVQIYSHALNPEEHQCPQFESEIDDMASYIGSVRVRLSGLLDTLRQANSVHLFFFHLLLCITMVTSALTGLVFPLQMRMFIREYKNGWYSPTSFIMSQTIAELPADIIGPLITLLIAYPLCHQPDSMYHWRLIGYCLVFIVTSLICKSQAQIVGAFLMDSVENSVFISCVCVTAPALLSGIPLRVRSMPMPLQWVSYGSFLRYSFESLMELRYGYGMCPCDPALVDGPLHASARAIPAHLENLATGLLELTVPNYTISDVNATRMMPSNTEQLTPAAGGAILPPPQVAAGQDEHENLFLKFLRLTSGASNLFLDSRELEQCSSYRSLYLISVGIDPGSLVFWATVMVSVFVLSRFLTYFAVKTVIKLRRS